MNIQVSIRKCKISVSETSFDKRTEIYTVTQMKWSTNSIEKLCNIFKKNICISEWKKNDLLLSICINKLINKYMHWN